ncbi:DUF5615 family PIN-like protein [Phaeodactylibacter sp.]|jgi:predicted nuclease of predicted toxin-antitoxin system|uniref:DUF5615 family PIN-like protein n=1 Tax=Phaeodactylibacter sp. TaxID=1940289 RepID=UPI0025EEBCD3|nr:DUF5615 family PIN-like protein [Phaeodactylibacter sp.]MCI4649737.1 DUF5615 family PIN-like protein [Phaeodactylibacter sp.]MCI5093016.1 DUF5615 family PIN-like protein [Phaeodactylibacter sp.]
MKILIDMNLSPKWVPLLSREGWEVKHWQEIGPRDAPDIEIFDWARKNLYIVFTHDLDFSALLAVTKAEAPSVIQVRTQNVMPQSLGSKLIPIIKQFDKDLSSGALLTVDEVKQRIRLLPL